MQRRRKRRTATRKSVWKNRTTRRLGTELLEERRVLDASGIAGMVVGNDFPPDLDLSSIGVQTASVGTLFSLDLNGLTTDVDSDGNPTGDAIRLVLDPDPEDTEMGASMTDGVFNWTPAADQVGTFEFAVIAIDDGTTPLADAETFTVEVMNQAPFLDLNGDDPGTTSNATFDEDAGPTVIADLNLVITDADSTTLAGASVVITDLSNGDDEFLSVDVTGTSIVGSYADGALILAGVDSIENYEMVLRSLTYDNTSQDPGTSRILEVTVNDGNVNSNTATILLQVNSENDAPDLAVISDVDLNVGDTMSVTVTATDPEGDALVFLLDHDDPGSNVPENATITSIDATSALIEWTPTEADAVGEYQFVVLVVDNASSPLADREAFTVTLTNPVPAVDLNGDDDEGGDFATDFTEGDDGVLIVDSDLTVVDADSANLESATITITNVLDGVEERVTVDTTGTDIISTYDSISGELSLTGTETVENYQMVLRTLKYDNDSTDPDTTDRVITVTVNDGENVSTVVTATVTVTASNAAPSLTVQEPFNDDATPVDAEINEEIIFTAVGTDTDTPSADLAFSLDLTDTGITGTTGTPMVIETAPGFATFQWTPLETGSFTMALVLTDTDGLTDRQVFTINVVDPMSSSIIVGSNHGSLDGNPETTLEKVAYVAPAESNATDRVFAEVEDDRYDIITAVFGA